MVAVISKHAGTSADAHSLEVCTLVAWSGTEFGSWLPSRTRALAAPCWFATIRGHLSPPCMHVRCTPTYVVMCHVTYARSGRGSLTLPCPNRLECSSTPCMEQQPDKTCAGALRTMRTRVLLWRYGVGATVPLYTHVEPRTPAKLQPSRTSYNPADRPIPHLAVSDSMPAHACVFVACASDLMGTHAGG